MMSNNGTINKRELKQKEFGLPKYTLLEEIFNAITHGIGAALAIAAIVLLPIFSRKTAIAITSATIYASTLFVLYIISTMYHALGMVKAKKVFRILDHCSIFLLIAGTYTPMCLAIIGGAIGWTLFGVVWATAILGIVLNSINVKKYSKFSMICYLAMGWCIIIAFKPLADKVLPSQIALLIIGGVAYTIGAVIYAKCKNIKFMHTLWHVFVLAGSILHFFFVFYCLKG